MYKAYACFMNIFVLDEDMRKSIISYNDKHLVKMQLESAQMLCTAVVLSGDVAPYKPTHINHPCSIWVRESISNWFYLRDMAYIMEDEWRFRFDKRSGSTHKAIDAVRTLIIPPLPDKGLTAFALAMPDKYKTGNAIESYRAYYTHEKHSYTMSGKVCPHKWTTRSKPAWMDKSIYPISEGTTNANV